MSERWKDIAGYEGIYMISDIGRVKSLERLDKRGFLRKEKFLKQSVNCRGYAYVVFQDDKAKVVHRLVAAEFIGNENNKPFVNHINGIKTDNVPSNLEWVTGKENTYHAFRIGLIVAPKGEFNPNAKLKNEQADEIREKYIRGKNTLKKLSKEYGVSISVVSKICRNKAYINEGGGNFAAV